MGIRQGYFFLVLLVRRERITRGIRHPILPPVTAYNDLHSLTKRETR